MLGRGGAQVQPMVREEGFHMQGYGQKNRKKEKEKIVILSISNKVTNFLNIFKN